MWRDDLRHALALSSLLALAGLPGLVGCALTAEPEETGELAEPAALVAVEQVERAEAAERIGQAGAVAPGEQEARLGEADWNADALAHASRRLGMEPAAAGEGLSWQTIGGGTTPEGTRFLRLQQRYRGLPILGADVVAVGRGEAVTSLHGNALIAAGALDGVDDQLGRLALDEERALAVAYGRYLAKVTDRTAELTVSRQKAELVITPAGAVTKAARLAYRTEMFTDQQGGMDPGLWVTLIDATTGEVLGEHNALHGAQASGPGGNPRVARSWVSQLDVEPTTATLYQMNTTRLATWNQRLRPPAIVTGPLSPIGDAAINDAHGFAEIALDHLLAWYGENSINGAGLKIVSRVHYGTNYANGFWDGAALWWGDGDGVTIYAPQGSLDIVAHELSHGYTSYHSNLTYSGQSGGVSESFSDIAGEAAESYYKLAAPDFVLGADIMVAGGNLRDLCNPTADGVSIDHFSRYTASTDPHYSSGIMNKAFCRTAKRLASGSPTGAATMASVRRASTAWYRANKVYWTSSTTFQQACQGTFFAASDLGFTDYEKWALRQSWIDVGITCGTATSPVTFAVDSISTFENAGVMIFTVTKTNYDGAFHAVTYAGASGTATVGVDYQDFSGTLSFAPSDTTRYIAVAINDDPTVEGNEKFTVNLSGLTGGGTIVGPQGIGTILNDD